MLQKDHLEINHRGRINFCSSMGEQTKTPEGAGSQPKRWESISPTIGFGRDQYFTPWFGDPFEQDFADRPLCSWRSFSWERGALAEMLKPAPARKGTIF